MLWCEIEKVARKIENIHGIQDIFTIPGGVA
jgi:hypothetical protein